MGGYKSCLTHNKEYTVIPIKGAMGGTCLRFLLGEEERMLRVQKGFRVQGS